MALSLLPTLIFRLCWLVNFLLLSLLVIFFLNYQLVEIQLDVRKQPVENVDEFLYDEVLADFDLVDEVVVFTDCWLLVAENDIDCLLLQIALYAHG